MNATKKKHHSKKNKSAWRKHADISDIEQFLEQERDEERIIGTTVNKLKDDEIFSVDVGTKKTRTELSKKQLRKLNAQKTAKSLSPLINSSKVQDPIAKRNYVNIKGQRPCHLRAKKVEARAKMVILTESNEDVNGGLDKLKKKKSNLGEVEFDKDLWSETEKVPKEFRVEWYKKELVEHNLRNIGKPIVKTPSETYRSRSQLKAVQLPHPGTSYNPTFDDFQDLVAEAVKKETCIINRVEHFTRTTTNKFSRLTSEQMESMKQKELIEGLPIDKSKKRKRINSDELIDDIDFETSNAPVRNNKKNRKIRRKHLEAKDRKSSDLQQNLEVKKIKDINQVALFEKEINRNIEKIEKKRKNLKNRLQNKKVVARRIGRLRFREPEIDVNQLDDISGNIRSLKPEGNLLLDRFKSLQNRNILPSSVLRRMRRKTMVKMYIKKSHKGEDIQTKNKIKPPKNSR